MTFNLFGYTFTMEKLTSKTRKQGRYSVYYTKGNKTESLGTFNSKKDLVDYIRLNHYNF